MNPVAKLLLVLGLMLFAGCTKKAEVSFRIVYPTPTTADRLTADLSTFQNIARSEAMRRVVAPRLAGSISDIDAFFRTASFRPRVEASSDKQSMFEVMAFAQHHDKEDVESALRILVAAMRDFYLSRESPPGWRIEI